MNKSFKVIAMNLEDIARISGVSRSTVSRVINNSPNVRPDTRERVLKVIAEHNYTPNVVARSLVTQRTRVIGIYIPYFVSDVFADPYFPTLIQAVTTYANEQDYDVMLWLRGQNAAPTHLHRRVLDNRITDGLILASTPKDDPLLEFVLERGRPYILNGRPWRHTDNTNYVDATNYQGAQQAVEHLMRLGHQRIAHISGKTDMCAGYDRRAGYLDTLKRNGLQIDEGLIFEGDFTETSGYVGMRRLLAMNPDAVFVASDQMALGALRALREARVSIPNDMAVVGFDDMPFATLAEPQLTTIRQPVQRQGYLAAEGLIGLIEGRITPPYQVSLPTQLVIREFVWFSNLN